MEETASLYDRRRMKIVILFISLLFASASAGSAEGPVLVLNTFAGPPLSTAGGTGMYDRIIKEAFRRIGREVSIVHLPAERGLVNADSGIDDGDFVRIAGLNSLYPNLVQVNEKITDFEFVAFARNVNLETTSWGSLKPYDVGIVRGWKILEENTRGVHSLIKVQNQKLLFTLLDKGRVDIVVYSRLEGYETVKALGLKGIKALDPPLASREMFLYLNRKHEQLVPLFVSALRAMKDDGTYDKIVHETLQPYLKGGPPGADLPDHKTSY